MREKPQLQWQEAYAFQGKGTTFDRKMKIEALFEGWVPIPTYEAEDIQHVQDFIDTVKQLAESATDSTRDALQLKRTKLPNDIIDMPGLWQKKGPLHGIEPLIFLMAAGRANVVSVANDRHVFRMKVGRRVVLKTGLAAAGFTVVGVPLAAAAPKAELWDRWLAHDPGARSVIGHQEWDTFLAAYLRLADDGIAHIAYGAVSAADRARLDAYIDALNSVQVGALNRAEQYAYWVNLYNAATVHLIVDNYPVDSILDLDWSHGLFNFGPWDAKLLRVEDEDLSLNDIEHRILRPIWGDPRTHYAVNCASLSCPNLMPVAFTAKNTETLLEENARAYVNHPRGVAFFGGDRLVVSKIYRWFKRDFGRRDRDVIAHLRAYATPALDERLAQFTIIDDHRYDWSLNDATQA